MFCRNCGASIPDGYNVCPSCGNVQQEANQAGAASSYPYQQPQQPQQPQQGYQQPYQGYQQPQQGYQQPYQGYQQPQYQTPTGPMPNPSSYLVMVIIGFFLGILWGVLTIGSYTKLKDAVARNDSVEAQAQAKKIRTVFIIGLVINIFAFFGYIAQGALS